MDLKLGEKLNGAKGGLAFSVNTCCYYLVSIIAIIIISAGKLSGTDASSYISFLVSPVAITITLALMFKLGKVSFKEAIPLKCHPKYFVIASLLIFGLLFSLSYLNTLFLDFLKLFGYEQKLTESSLPDLDGWKIVPAIFVIAVLPALFEEALFRGVILGGAQNSAGSVRSIFIIGFLFALFHGSAEQTIYQFICGCLFAFLAIRSGSVLPTVFMHFVNNALIIILTACNCFDEVGNLAVSSQVNIVITVLSAVSLVVAVVWLILDKTQLKGRQQGETTRFFLFASVGIIVMGLTWILGLFGL
jgi:membrane protease YdiL (CAAX protease family)